MDEKGKKEVAQLEVDFFEKCIQEVSALEHSRISSITNKYHFKRGLLALHYCSGNRWRRLFTRLRIEQQLGAEQNALPVTKFEEICLQDVIVGINIDRVLYGTLCVKPFISMRPVRQLAINSVLECRSGLAVRVMIFNSPFGRSISMAQSRFSEGMRVAIKNPCLERIDDGDEGLALFVRDGGNICPLTGPDVEWDRIHDPPIDNCGSCDPVIQKLTYCLNRAEWMEAKGISDTSMAVSYNLLRRKRLGTPLRKLSVAATKERDFLLAYMRAALITRSELWMEAHECLKALDQIDLALSLCGFRDVKAQSVLLRKQAAILAVLEQTVPASVCCERSLALDPDNALAISDADCGRKMNTQLSPEELSTARLPPNYCFFGPVAISDAGDAGRGLFATAAVQTDAHLMATASYGRCFYKRSCSKASRILGSYLKIQTVECMPLKVQEDLVTELAVKLQRNLIYPPRLYTLTENDSAECRAHIPDTKLFFPPKWKSIQQKYISDFARLRGIVRHNAIRIRDHGADGDKSVWGVFGLLSFVNHSCWPNCRVEFVRDLHAYLIAKRDICSGEELTISYWNIDCSQDFLTRQQECLKLGFECKCSRCKYEDAVRAKHPSLHHDCLTNDILSASRSDVICFCEVAG